MDKRIQSTDAIFVDIIHTNSGELWQGAVSFPDTLGHVDFYPNGGSHQIGCTDVCIGESCINIDFIDFFRGRFEFILKNTLFKTIYHRI